LLVGVSAGIEVVVKALACDQKKKRENISGRSAHLVCGCGVPRKEWIDYAAVSLLNTSPEGVSISRLLSKIILRKVGISREKQGYELRA